MRFAHRALAFRISAAVALALVMSVAVAWTTAVFRGHYRGTWTSTTFWEGRGGMSGEVFGATYVQVFDVDWTAEDKAWSMDLSQPMVHRSAIRAVLQSMRTAEQDSTRGDFVFAFGWPLRCVWCHAQNADFWLAPTAAPSDPALDLSRKPAPGERGIARLLPLRPLWLGIAGNVGFYSAIWFALLSVPAMRRALRRRRGRCGRCGYMLKGISGAKCPECGAAIPPRRGTLAV